MAVRREILIIVALLVLIAVLVKAVEFFKVDIVEADAREFVLEDLDSKYPDADMEIMSITPKYNEYNDRYFEVKARVTENADSPCPERSHVFYNYPVQNFVALPEETITSGCTVCKEGICVIAFQEEAIIASHTFDGTADIHSYLTSYTDAVPQVTEELNSWAVNWNSDDAAYSYAVTLHRNGTVLGINKTEKITQQ